MDKVPELSTRRWYMAQTLANGWSRDVLALQIEARSHARHGKAVSNFAALLPAPQSDLAQQALKDPYIFDFLTLTEPFQEREARRVAVSLPADFHEQGATIAVLDDGEGMNAGGLKQHWLIGKSLKRDLTKLPLGRQQIGKFGIGKLATYVLANRLTHISKAGGKYYSTSMNFKTVDDRGDEEVEPKTPIKISLRELTEDQTKQALKDWTGVAAFQNCGLRLFGTGAEKSWTFAILSDLKNKVHEIRRGRLEWVLRTALPLRDDFSIYLDGAKLESSSANPAL